MSFRSISLNSTTVTEIEHYIGKDKKYRSIAAFVEEAARLRLQELEKEIPA